MYHELTKQEIRRRTRKRMAGLLAIVLVVVLVWLSSNAIGASLREQGELSVRNAISNSSVMNARPRAFPSRASELRLDPVAWISVCTISPLISPTPRRSA